MIIGNVLVTAAVHDGVPYLTAINLDTPENRALAKKLGNASEEAYEAAYQAERAGHKSEPATIYEPRQESTRRRWTLEEKIECAKYAIEHGNQAAADKFGVSKGMAATLKSNYSTGKLK